jgi:hypothetical protein
MRLHNTSVLAALIGQSRGSCPGLHAESAGIQLIEAGKWQMSINDPAAATVHRPKGELQG